MRALRSNMAIRAKNDRIFETNLSAVAAMQFLVHVGLLESDICSAPQAFAMLEVVHCPTYFCRGHAALDALKTS